MISVAILAWNNLSTVKESLEILFNDLPSIEVVVVDNGSTDGLFDFMMNEMVSRETLNYIHNDENMGISVGKNEGIRACEGDYILLLDGDIVPVKGSVHCLYKKMNDLGIRALGFKPTAFTTDKGPSGSPIEEYCHDIVNIKPVKSHAIYYGMFHRDVFYEHNCWLREDGVFGEVGYGWEDYDFYQQMSKAGITQYHGDINKKGGRYYHEINSSIKLMGHDKYVETSKARHAVYQEAWC